MAAPSYSPLPYTTPDELWQMALSDLRYQMTKATFNTWLADSHVLTPVSNRHTLVIAVRNQYAQEWLTYRLSPLIARTLTDMVGYGIEFCFVSKYYAKDEAMYSPEEPISGDVSKRSDQKVAQDSHKPNFPSSTKGEKTMTNQPNATRIRIYSHIIQSRFLHVEDTLAIGKLRLFAGNYRKDHGMSSYAHAYVDIADARVIFSALAGGEQGFNHKEYKGTPPRKKKAAVSRVLSVVVKGENVYIELKSGPGKLTSTGAITPCGSAKVEVNVGFKLYEARRMAASVLAYIHAWDVLRMMVNQQTLSPPLPYTSTPLSPSLLIPTTNVANGIQVKPANRLSNPNGASRSPVVAANGRPVTRKDPFPKTNGIAVKPAAPADTQSVKSETAVAPQQLKYGDGRLVDMQNLTEVQTFQRYVTEKAVDPNSKAVLLRYYQQRTQTAAAHPVAG
jgi:hypothetical protein